MPGEPPSFRFGVDTMAQLVSTSTTDELSRATKKEEPASNYTIQRHGSPQHPSAKIAAQRPDVITKPPNVQSQYSDGEKRNKHSKRSVIDRPS